MTLNKPWSKTSHRGMSVDLARDGKESFIVDKWHPHVLIAGSAGSGMSNVLNTILASLMGTYSPEDTELYLADFKNVEFNQYKGEYTIPHARKVIGTTDPHVLLDVLEEIHEEVDKRLKMLESAEVFDIDDYNTALKRWEMPRLVVILTGALGMLDHLDVAGIGCFREHMMHILKWGRKTGCHIIMLDSGSFNEMTERMLEGFNVRLGCRMPASLSNRLFGTDKASKIKTYEQVCINNDSHNPACSCTVKEVVYTSPRYIKDLLLQLNNECKHNHVNRKGTYTEIDL